MSGCDECGNHDLQEVVIEGQKVYECGLCSALSGDERAVTKVLRSRQARDYGMDPEVFELQKVLDRIDGLRVKRSEQGDPAAILWPHVTMVSDGDTFLMGLENMLKSIALGASSCEVHWIVEVEYQSELCYTLKPRFHRDVEAIGSEQIRAAQRDLARLARGLERDRNLSWWRF